MDLVDPMLTRTRRCLAALFPLTPDAKSMPSRGLWELQ